MAAGGKRAGSGRPLLNEEKRQSITIRVSPDTKDMLDDLRKRGYNLGREVDKIVTFAWLANENGSGK